MDFLKNHSLDVLQPFGYICRVRNRKSSISVKAARWGKKLAADVSAVLSLYPDADPEDVRLTLISLQSPPLERLNRSLRRGQGFAAFRK